MNNRQLSPEDVYHYNRKLAMYDVQIGLIEFHTAAINGRFYLAPEFQCRGYVYARSVDNFQPIKHPDVDGMDDIIIGEFISTEKQS